MKLAGSRWIDRGYGKTNYLIIPTKAIPFRPRFLRGVDLIIAPQTPVEWNKLVTTLTTVAFVLPSPVKTNVAS